MADGLCTGDIVSNVIEKTIVKDYDIVGECINNDSANVVQCDNVKSFYITSDSDKLFDKLCSVKGSNEGFLDMEMPCSPGEDDCRKKRCADRYDSSESSDSGVAVLSCTDCSGSSTASSDIADPGSPFSTGSSHSDDSGSQPAKMPPTQFAHHPPWPWTMGEGIQLKNLNKTAFPKKIKLDENALEAATKQNADEDKTPPASMSSTLLNHQNTISQSVPQTETTTVASDYSSKAPSSNSTNEKLVKTKKVVKKQESCAQQAVKTQGKITEYFKSQMKANGIKKALSNLPVKANSGKSTDLHKYFSLVGALKQNGTKAHLRKIDVRTVNKIVKQLSNKSNETKARKLSPVTIPRKILPAPSKVCDNISVSNINNVNNFAPTVTLTTLAIPPNLTYIHTKTPKPPDNFIVQQFTTLGSDKINAIPIVNTPCINTVLHPLQKITTINNFNCIKLNATVVPIVKLNTLPSKSFNNVSIHVDHSIPPQSTVVSSQPKIASEVTTQQQQPVLSASTVVPQKHQANLKLQSQVLQEMCRIEEQSVSSLDSGVSSSNKELEVSVNFPPQTVIEPQKSPILSQPKTIRFPAKKLNNSDFKEPNSSSHSNDSASCRWEECHAQFDTNGALLEHLQLKHVISQATQEQYVCLWLGCKVHGRTSCSRTWLERHVLAHAGTKLFRCIVEGCGMRYNSQLALERHVNGHFSTDGSQNASAKKSVESSSVKLFKRNGKRIRFRRQPWSARMFDFFDNGIMEGLQHQLLKVNEVQTQGQKDAVPGDSVLLNSQLLAKRIENDGSSKILLRWHPTDVIPDEWVRECDYSETKTVSIRTLQPTSINSLKPLLFPQNDRQYVRHKQRRKPSKSST